LIQILDLLDAVVVFDMKFSFFFFKAAPGHTVACFRHSVRGFCVIEKHQRIQFNSQFTLD
jgi:hypothetical protein